MCGWLVGGGCFVVFSFQIEHFLLSLTCVFQWVRSPEVTFGVESFLRVIFALK